ncbi:MAG: hypothetical protein CL853_04055 [Crocinitomicaceae bacterium]|nr:hypothetical protein [Crocinitomicaceae bacterium]|tara:strand:- start:690 stop:1235 length:546 start_codon:yes stop_codon:yes gene_type:complete
MKTLKEYTIPFSSLKNGKNLFSFELNRSFFETFNWEEFIDCSFKVDLSLIKSETMLDMNFTILGEVISLCDRCMDNLKLKLNNEFRQLIKFVENEQDVFKDELEFLSLNSYEINIAPYLFEYCLLSMPKKKIHQKIQDCNQENIQILEQYLLTKEKVNEKTKENDEIDSRWDKLKELKNKK